MQTRLRYLLALSLAICLLPESGHTSSGRRTFIIVERPGNLLIYNAYQQTLSEHDKGLLASFLPLQIIDEDGLLGDGVTGCITVEINGNRYFLVKDRDRQVLGLNKAGMTRVYRDVVTLQDTVELVDADHATLTLPGGNGSATLRKGDVIERWFSQGTQTYTERLGEKPVFGWLDEGANVHIRPWKTPVAPGQDPTARLAQARLRVEERLSDANSVLLRLFRFLNSRSGKHRATPYWKVESAPGGLICVLEAQGSTTTYASSTTALTHELERVLLGLQLSVRNLPGQIFISGGS